MAEQPRPHIPTEYLWVTRKFGQNDDIGTASDPETLWTLSNGLFPWDTFSGVGPTLSVASSSTDDAAGGIGAQTVLIYTVDENFYPIVYEVTLNGTTPVEIGAFPHPPFRMHVESVGSSGMNVGAITVTGPGPVMYVQIRATEGQSQIGIFVVPNTGGLEAEIFKWWASVGRGGNSTTAEVQLRTQAPGKAWRVRQVAHSSNGAPYIMPMEGDAALQVPAGTRIELQIAEVTANNTAVTGGFWLGWRRKTRGHYSRSTVYPTTEVP